MVFRNDNDIELCNKEFDEFCTSSGILRYKAVKHTPQQNGIAKRMNRTFLDKVTCMFISSSLPSLFWGEAIISAAYLVNLSLSYALELEPLSKYGLERFQTIVNLECLLCSLCTSNYRQT